MLGPLSSETTDTHPIVIWARLTPEQKLTVAQKAARAISLKTFNPDKNTSLELPPQQILSYWDGWLQLPSQTAALLDRVAAESQMVIPTASRAPARASVVSRVQLPTPTVSPTGPVPLNRLGRAGQVLAVIASLELGSAFLYGLWIPPLPTWPVYGGVALLVFALAALIGSL